MGILHGSSRVSFALTRTRPGCLSAVPNALVGCAVVLHAAANSDHRKGIRRTDTASHDAARAARELWVLITSLATEVASAARVIRLYARRMTIEESFRDLKSGSLGAGLEHSLMHKRERLANLLVLFALVQFSAWLIGWCEEQGGRGNRLELRRKPRRRHYSTIRLGMEVLKRRA